MHYFIAGNFWLTVSLLVFVGRKYERSNPEMYSVLGLGRYLSLGEYSLLMVSLLVLSVACFALHWFHQNKLRISTTDHKSEQVSAPEHLVTTASHSPVFAWLPIAGTYSIFMLGNVVLPSAFWHSGSNSWLAYAGLFCSGILVSELAVLGGWLALSTERLSHRTLIGGVLLCLTTTCFLIGVRIADVSGPPFEWCLFLYGLSVIGCFVSALPLGWLRWRYGWHIKWKHAEQDATRTSQVSIAYMLSWMSAVAVMIALIRSVVPTSTGATDLAEVAAACSFFAVYTACLFVPSFLLAMQSPTPYWVIMPLLVVLLGLAPVTISSITWFLGSEFDNEEILFFYLYSIGFITSVCVVLWSLRRFGFALRKKQFVERS